MNLVPLKKKIVLKQEEVKKETDFGLVLPSSSNEERPMVGIIVAVGDEVGKNPEKEHECECHHGEGEGHKHEMTALLKPGTKVLFSKYSPTEVELEGEKLLIVDEKDVLAVIQ